MRFLLLLLLPALLCACGGYEIKNLAKSDIDLVADEFIAETRTAVRELVVKLYKRNPSQLQKNPGMTIEGRLAQLRVHRHTLDFPELNDQQGIDAMNMAFDPAFRGDRVFALVVGLGSMLREAYSYKAEMFLNRSTGAGGVAGQCPQRGGAVMEVEKYPQARWRTLPHYSRVQGGCPTT